MNIFYIFVKNTIVDKKWRCFIMAKNSKKPNNNQNQNNQRIENQNREDMNNQKQNNKNNNCR